MPRPTLKPFALRRSEASWRSLRSRSTAVSFSRMSELPKPEGAPPVDRRPPPPPPANLALTSGGSSVGSGSPSRRARIIIRYSSASGLFRSRRGGERGRVQNVVKEESKVFLPSPSALHSQVVPLRNAHLERVRVARSDPVSPRLVPTHTHGLYLLVCPGVHRDAAHEGDMDAEAPVPSAALEAEERAECHARPLWVGLLTIDAELVSWHRVDLHLEILAHRRRHGKWLGAEVVAREQRDDLVVGCRASLLSPARLLFSLASSSASSAAATLEHRQTTPTRPKQPNQVLPRQRKSNEDGGRQAQYPPGFAR